MTDAAIIAISAAVGTVIGAIAPMMLAYATLRQGRANAAEAAKAVVANDLANAEIKTQVKEVHVLADGNLSKMTNDYKVAVEKISGLEKMVAALAKREESVALQAASQKPKS